ncbi:hypothetical protein Misp01_36140 [Microtetraspora sp. NBRC 13810]|uniref:CGNR zinc finger domain-containing protein n=1 Tax=Microtetraspora sp. NBRC 13810 TaxID=3030990 RepID=UPI0024A26DA0|nr:CGNR zinc finger domain-containing protein [Microtetraspora sp. NBRC 13810]GLW08484.1 hypothetical protein Misp01_36140 [Microtetraspora sp. NBRC 13810]
MTTAAELVRDFVNTYDVEADSDELASPAELAVWLRERGLVSADDRAGEEDLALAVGLREGLRTTLRHHHDRAGTPAERPAGTPVGTAPEPFSPQLDAALAALPLRISVPPGGPLLVPAVDGTAGGLAAIAAAVAGAHAEGAWPRLKVCAESTCQWAFIDSSKNRSRAWCSMKVCGNRTKTRAYRARQVVERPSRHSRR